MLAPECAQGERQLLRDVADEVLQGEVGDRGEAWRDEAEAALYGTLLHARHILFDGVDVARNISLPIDGVEVDEGLSGEVVDVGAELQDGVVVVLLSVEAVCDLARQDEGAFAAVLHVRDGAVA